MQWLSFSDNNNKGNKLWQKANNLIPGGNNFFSKHQDLHLPKNWPNYFSKSKDCYVWDLDGKKYIDMMFYVGTNTLGYSNSTIDLAVNRPV